ncbi:hypothetical protein Hanom_Chr17g01558081 [Helianthus anomalus]
MFYLSLSHSEVSLKQRRKYEGRTKIGRRTRGSERREDVAVTDVEIEVLH